MDDKLLFPLVVLDDKKEINSYTNFQKLVFIIQDECYESSVFDYSPGKYGPYQE